jgi:hypothetical protein
MKSRPKKTSPQKNKSPEIILNRLDYDTLVPVSRSGFGLVQNTYGGGRIGAVVNFFGGISRIEYWSIAPMHLPNMFFQGDPTSAYSRCFRSQVVVDDAPYNLEFSDTHHFPFGYKSTFRIPSLGIELLHRLTLIDDALIFSIEVIRNPRNLPIRQRFEHHGHNLVTLPERTHTKWEEGVVPNGWTMSATDRLSDAHWQALEDEKNQVHTKYPPPVSQGPREGTTWISILGEKSMSMKSTYMNRFYFTSDELFRRGGHACALLFAPGREQLVSRAGILGKRGFDLVKKEENEFARNLARAPQFHSGDCILDSMAANVPPVYKSFFVADVPGTAAGASLGYYIWGWDTLNCADMHVLSGQVDFSRDVLKFYRDTAHPQLGLGHQYTTDQPPTPRVTMPFAAQMVYVIFLHQYGILTGDKARWREYFPFAKWIFEQCLLKINARGLGEGHALWPDIPDTCGHSGHDITIFNNSIQYQGVRSIEAMAAFCGDADFLEREARLFCRLGRCKNGRTAHELPGPRAAVDDSIPARPRRPGKTEGLRKIPRRKSQGPARLAALSALGPGIRRRRQPARPGVAAAGHVHHPLRRARRAAGCA